MQTDDSKAADTAWKIHAAIVDWTGKVDTKASFTLTIEAAILAGIVTLSGGGRALSHEGGLGLALYVVGVVLLIASMLLAIWVVRPRLRSKALDTEAPTNYIYFGHLRELTEQQVLDHLRNSDILPVLSKQLVQMSKIAWDKHKAVQRSMTVAPLAVAIVAFSAIF